MNLADRSYNKYGLFIQKRSSGNIIAKTQELLNNDCTETLDLPLFSVGVKTNFKKDLLFEIKYRSKHTR